MAESERASVEFGVPGRPLILAPADDRRFREAVLLAVELFAPTDGTWGPPVPPRKVDDERLLAAAQAMLRAAYPLATILADPRTASGESVTWQVYRDPLTLDGALLDAARSGDATAASRLEDRYHGIMLLFTWPICGGPEAAMSAAAEAMARLLRPDVSVEAERVADALLRMAHDAAVARRREPTEGDPYPATEARTRLFSILARLSASQATGLALAYGEGLSDAEVAIALGIDEDDVPDLLRRGLASLVEVRA